MGMRVETHGSSTAGPKVSKSDIALRLDGRVLRVPVGVALVSHGDGKNRLFTEGRADDLQAERQMVFAEAHRDRDRGPACQVARPAVAAHVSKAFVEAEGDGRSDL